MTLLAIVAIHTAANEPPKVRQVMNKIHRNVEVAVRCGEGLVTTGTVWCSATESRGGGFDEVVVPLVERSDTEFNTDFSAKSRNFRGLVLFCIEADFCTQIRILQHFSRTTRFAILCTAPISKFEQNFVKLFRIFAQNSAKNRYFSTFFIEFCTDFDQNFTEFRRIF